MARRSMNLFIPRCCVQGFRVIRTINNKKIKKLWGIACEEQ